MTFHQMMTSYIDNSKMVTFNLVEFCVDNIFSDSSDNYADKG